MGDVLNSAWAWAQDEGRCPVAGVHISVILIWNHFIHCAEVKSYHSNMSLRQVNILCEREVSQVTRAHGKLKWLHLTDPLYARPSNQSPKLM
jgi:hypothetical protein